jgi:hypothetical protein
MERRNKGGILKITKGKQTCNKRVTFEERQHPTMKN